MGKTKVAIVGGGMGALAAAWELSRQPRAADRFEITVYTRGWRLGGKGASGAAIDASDRRIEEHGLHILMGFYENALGIMKDSYDALDAHPEVWKGSLIPWVKALTPQDRIWTPEPRGSNWEFWEIPLGGLAPIAGGVSVLQHFLDEIGGWIKKFRRMIFGPLVPDVIAPELIPALPNLSRAKQLEIEKALGGMLDDAWKELHAAGPGVGVRLRQGMSGLYLAAAALMGLIHDGVLVPPHDLSTLDRFDFKQWVRERGHADTFGIPRELSWESPPVRAFYDLAFSMNHTIAAGVACTNLMRMLFGWKKSVYFKMNSGMGDIVFAPLFLMLKHLRGVEFRFFHRLSEIKVDPATRTIDGLVFERQIAGAAGYAPLDSNAKATFPAWPNEPIVKHMPDEYQRVRGSRTEPPHDFETELKSPFADKPLTLVKRKDEKDDGFDVAVLAVSVGALQGELGKPLRVSRRFEQMLDRADTIPTQAFQVWFTRSPEGDGGMGWDVGRAMGGYAEPYSSVTDMNQVLDKENFSTPPGTVAYSCGAFPKAPGDKEKAKAEARKNAEGWLDQHAFRIWPAVATQGHFDESELVDRTRGFYVRANVDPSDRYVLSPQGRTAYRLAPGESGFGNLFLAGDWVRTELSSGCLESAALAGRLAGTAIVEHETAAAKPRYVVQDSDWILRPPGVLEDVTMHAFLLKVDRLAALETLCRKMFALPGSPVEVTPVPPGIVALVFADIRRGYSQAAPEEGLQKERDVTFFVPVTLKVAGKRQGFAAIVPYIYVDNWAGMLTGREVYGFRKLLADIEFTADERRFTCKSLVRRKSGAGEWVEDHVPVVELRSGVRRDDALAADLSAADAVLERSLVELGVDLGAAASLLQVPLVFLKQFRDVANATLAAHQSIVSANARITAIRSARILHGDFDLALPRYDSLRIIDTLGLRANPKPLGIAFRLDVDFVIPPGVELWRAV